MIIASSGLLYSFVNGAVVPLTTPFLPPPGIIIQPHGLTNSTSLGVITPDFEALIDEAARGPPLPVLSCLEAGLLIVGNRLAIESFTGRIPGQGWSVNNIAVAVSTQGVPGNSIERRFVMWGIVCALALMKEKEEFESAIWTLKMRGEVVGYLTIHPQGLGMMDSRDSSVVGTAFDSTLSSVGSETNGSVMSDSNTFAAGRLRVLVTVMTPPRPIDLRGVLWSFLGTTVEAAGRSPSEVIGSRFISIIEGSYIQLLISPGRNLTPKVIIMALTLIPSKLAESRIRESFQVDVYLGIVKAATMQVLPGTS